MDYSKILNELRQKKAEKLAAAEALLNIRDRGLKDCGSSDSKSNRTARARRPRGASPAAFHRKYAAARHKP